MEVTKWLKPLVSVSRIGDSASVQAVTRVNADYAKTAPAALKIFDTSGKTTFATLSANRGHRGLCSKESDLLRARAPASAPADCRRAGTRWK